MAREIGLRKVGSDASQAVPISGSVLGHYPISPARQIARYADDKAVDDFARVAKDQRLPLDYGDDKRLAELISSDDDPAGNLEEIAKLLGQSPAKPKL